MSYNWKKFQLKNFCTKIGSGATPTGGKATYTESGEFALIRSQNVLDFDFSNDGLAYINKSQAKKLDNVTIEEDDVLINITGDSVARVCMVPNEILPARVNQHVSILRTDKEKFSSRLLKYILLSKENKDKLLSLASSGATRNALTKTMLENFEIYAPDNIDDQEELAIKLQCLDDKIVNNNHINQTLESITQALFKSWFVDFDPVQAKMQAKAEGNDPQLATMCAISGKTENELLRFSAEKRDELAKTADLFPDKLVESEMGMIPEGWEVKSLNEIVTVKYGKDHKKLNDGDIPVYGSGGIMRYVDKALYKEESVLIPRKGSLNNLMYVDDPFWSVDTMFFTMFHKENFAKYTFYFLQTYNLSEMNVGSAVPSMTTAILNGLKIISPTEQVLEFFDNKISSLYKEIKNNNKEIKSISQLRDSILPRLLNGELKIKDNA